MSLGFLFLVLFFILKLKWIMEVFLETWPVTYCIIYGLLHTLTVSRIPLVEDNRMNGTDMRLGCLVMSSRAVPWHIWHMQHLNIIWRCWLWFWERLSQCIPYSNAFWNSSVVFLFGNPGGFVCCILYRVQLSRTKIYTFRKGVSL